MIIEIEGVARDATGRDESHFSRNHAVLVQENGKFHVEDQGSLNGTFVNRRRIDNAPLTEGDELQIGKYRMTFIA